MPIRRPRRSRTHAASFALAAGLAAAGAATGAARPAAAQSASDDRLDQGVADLSPLSTSLRNDLRADLRGPLGFTDIRRTDDGRLVRESGALRATFDRSIYVPTRGGLMPVLPPGLVYEIGDDGMPLRPGVGGRTSGPMLVATLLTSTRRVHDPLVPAAAGRIDRRIDLAPAALAGAGGTAPPLRTGPPQARPDTTPGAAAPRPNEPRVLPEIIRDRDYRERRVHELLRRAVATAGAAD